ncbi:MAG: hypothetical protein R2726_14075 [Acidimicrobiales bacterium]
MTDPRRPSVTDDPAPATSVRFAGAARVLAPAVRRRGLDVPSWRSPPRVTSADRTLRRRPDGSVVVAVRVRGRPWTAVLADMIEGVVVANRLLGPDADATRTALWAAVERDGRRDEPRARRPARSRAGDEGGRRPQRQDAASAPLSGRTPTRAEAA